MAYNHISNKDMFVDFYYEYDLNILMLLLILRTWCLKKRRKMLLLWNVMQTMNFKYVLRMAIRPCSIKVCIEDGDLSALN